jgi:hypothetical protein
MEIIDPQPLKDGFEAIFMGHVKLKGGKIGQRWILAKAFDPQFTAEDYDRQGVASYFSHKGSRLIGGVYSAKGDLSEDGLRIEKMVSNVQYLRNVKGPGIDATEAMAKVDARAASRLKAETKAKTDTNLQRLANDVGRIGALVPWGDRSAFIAAFGDMVRKAIEDQKKR